MAIQTVSVCWQNRSKLYTYFTLHSEGNKGRFVSKTQKKHKKVLLFDDFPRISRGNLEKEAGRKISYEDLIWNTQDGIEIEPFYTEKEAGDFFLAKTALPGEFPFVRGTKKNNSWLLAERIKLTTLKETENCCACGSTGRGGRSNLNSAGRNQTRGPENSAKRDRPLQTGINFALKEDPQNICALFLSACAGKEIDTKKLSGAVFFDPLSHLLGHGCPETPLDENMDKIAQTIGYLSDIAPAYAAFSEKAQTYKDSGATVSQELAFTVAARGRISGYAS